MGSPRTVLKHGCSSWPSSSPKCLISSNYNLGTTSLVFCPASSTSDVVVTQRYDAEIKSQSMKFLAFSLSNLANARALGSGATVYWGEIGWCWSAFWSVLSIVLLSCSVLSKLNGLTMDEANSCTVRDVQLLSCSVIYPPPELEPELMA